MKRLSLFLVILVAAVAAFYFVLNTKLPFIDINPFPTPKDQLEVLVKRPKISKNMKITNNSTITVKVLVFNANDKAFDTIAAVARKAFTLAPGKSDNYPRDNYRFKLFKKGTKLLQPDTLMKKSGVIGSDVTITGNGKRLKVHGSPKKPVTFVNQAGEEIKIGYYNPKDEVYLIPRRTFSLSDGQTIKWDDAPPVFRIRVFRPQLADKILATRTDVRDQSEIVIRKKR